MAEYERRTISFTLPRDQELIDLFDKLAEEKGGLTKAGHHLLQFYKDVSPKITIEIKENENTN